MIAKYEFAMAISVANKILEVISNKLNKLIVYNNLFKYLFINIKLNYNKIKKKRFSFYNCWFKVSRLISENEKHNYIKKAPFISIFLLFFSKCFEWGMKFGRHWNCRLTREEKQSKRIEKAAGFNETTARVYVLQENAIMAQIDVLRLKRYAKRKKSGRKSRCARISLKGLVPKLVAICCVNETRPTFVANSFKFRVVKGAS